MRTASYINWSTCMVASSFPLDLGLSLPEHTETFRDVSAVTAKMHLLIHIESGPSMHPFAGYRGGLSTTPSTFFLFGTNCNVIPCPPKPCRSGRYLLPLQPIQSCGFC